MTLAGPSRTLCGQPCEEIGGAVSQVPGAVDGAAERVLSRRAGPGQALADDAERVARACHDMAVRFHRGGKLVVFGAGAPSTDAQHLSVEFIHPVIVGKRAFPAISLASDVATVTGVAADEGFDEVFAHQLRHLAAGEDIALGISSRDRSDSVRRALQVARELGMLRIVLSGGDQEAADAWASTADHVFVARSDDPLVV